tara:strand:- start:286 stop:744 length:459 start_codon:yes stop_codon:yes gene_type:complete
MENYYTPKIEEFHEGFEYEQKNSFGDGTVKTVEQYNLAGWEKRIFGLDIYPYLNRTMTGRNSKNLPSAVRVKYLDGDDIESLGWKKRLGTSIEIYYLNWDEEEGNNKGIWLEKKGEMYTILNAMTKINFMQFWGFIKNKSELKKLMQQLNIL